MNIPTASSNETAPPSPESITSLVPETAQSVDVIPAEAGIQLAEQPSHAELTSVSPSSVIASEAKQSPLRHAELVSASSSFEQALIRTADTVFKMAKTIEDTFFKLLKPISPSV